jgi:isopentenyl-diphosphate delta-isomerase type 1
MPAFSTDNELLDVVDSEDRVIGQATRAEIHRNGLLHRAVHLFLFNAYGDIFVQRRSALKDRHPLKLDSSAAGHVDAGEAYDRTAVRELEEELGIVATPTEVLRVRACPETDGEHVVLYEVRSSVAPRPNPEEIVWGGFMNPEELTRSMETNPDDFVPAFVLLWTEFRKRTA